MAQLGNDCFAPGQDLMTTAEALALIDREIVSVVTTERIPLTAARGRILAEGVEASGNVPPHDNAAVDGYAFRHADLGADGKTRLPIIGRAAAGHPWQDAVPPGHAIRIFTGAVMPRELDTIAMQEDCDANEEAVSIPAGLSIGANRRRAGEDIAAGSQVLSAGHILRPQDVGLVAATGQDHVAVHAPLRVTVFSTGDEILEPGQPLPAGAIHDSNRYALMALLEGMGCRVRDLGILPDDAAAVTDGIKKAALDSDLVLTSGGVSVGEEDHVRDAVAALGRLNFWRVAIRPGRPLALGQVGDTAFVGIPGNPVAVMVTFMIFVRPIIQRLAGAVVVPPLRFPVAAAFSCRKKVGRREWVRARLDGTIGALPAAVRFERDGAGILTSMVETDGFIELAEDVAEVAEGDVVPFLPYSEVLA
jgi:molybdopterin molybdotransferase